MPRGNQDTPTPIVLVRSVEEHFGIQFEYDMAADKTNAKCPIFFDEGNDSLKMDWPRDKWCWLNPPFWNLGRWVKKVHQEVQLGSKAVTIWPLSGDRNMELAWKHAHVSVVHGRVWPLIRGVMICRWEKGLHPSVGGLVWDKKTLTPASW